MWRKRAELNLERKHFSKSYRIKKKKYKLWSRKLVCWPCVISKLFWWSTNRKRPRKRKHYSNICKGDPVYSSLFICVSTCERRGRFSYQVELAILAIRSPIESVWKLVTFPLPTWARPNFSQWGVGAGVNISTRLSVKWRL